MNGIHFTLWIGPVVPIPAPPNLLEGFEQATITQTDSGRSGFQLTFNVARDRGLGLLDYPPLLLQQLRPGFRVLIIVTIGFVPTVLMDGLITNHQLAPSRDPGGTKLTVTGEDVSVAMDLHELSLPYPGMADWMIANMIIARYAVLGMIPLVIPHPGDMPSTEVRHRNGTDQAVLNEMAQRWGYSFFVRPGPLPGSSIAYWGPTARAGIPQRALTFSMGSMTNLSSIQFQSDATKPKFVYGLVQESETGAPIPVIGVPAMQPLAAMPAFIGNAPFVGSKRLEDDQAGDVARAFATASGEFTRSIEGAVTASGEIDGATYGRALEARGLVDVRGVGLTFDGTYYAKSVTHTISRGSYKQSFNLEREGTMPLSPVVRTW